MGILWRKKVKNACNSTGKNPLVLYFRRFWGLNSKFWSTSQINLCPGYQNSYSVSNHFYWINSLNQELKNNFHCQMIDDTRFTTWIFSNRFSLKSKSPASIVWYINLSLTRWKHSILFLNLFTRFHSIEIGNEFASAMFACYFVLHVLW